MKSCFEHSVTTVKVGEKITDFDSFFNLHFLVAPLRNDRSVT